MRTWDGIARLERTRRQFMSRAGAIVLGFGLLPLLQACGGGGSSGPTVKMTDALRFDPATLTVKAGATVTWQNASSLTHTVTDDPAKAQNKADAKLPAGVQPWDSGNVAPGATWSHTFDKPGDHTYFCIPHELSGMVAKLTVTS